MFIIPHPQKMEMKAGTIKAVSFFVNADCDEIYAFANSLNCKNADTGIEFKKDTNLKEEHYKIEIS